MNAIILAAGQGRRLRPVTDHFPKCLISVGGVPILTRMIKQVQRCGFSNLVIVAGFESARIQRHVDQMNLGAIRVQVVINERFAETNNLYSLWLALKGLCGPTTILNGDDLFNVRILENLRWNSADASASIDDTAPLPSDAMRAIIRQSRVISLGKTIPENLASGNAIGLYRFSGYGTKLLRNEIEHWVRRGRVREFYVAAISRLALRLRIEAVSTQGLTWCEVDDSEDLSAAPTKLAKILLEERQISPCIGSGELQETYHRPSAGIDQLKWIGERHQGLSETQLTMCPWMFGTIAPEYASRDMDVADSSKL